MTHFLDGPAKGAHLMLRRAPLFLRVTQSAAGFDALDQLDDSPAAGERLHAYRRVERPTSMHLDYFDAKTRRKVGAWFTVARYRLVAGDQPAHDVMADRSRWRAWCRRAAAAECSTAEGGAA